MTSRAKELMKKGWHPEKPGATLKGQVNGLLHRNKSSDDDAANHQARPLASLRDPSSFAPPPKRTGSGLIPAPKPASTPRKVITAPSKYQDPRADPVTPPEGQKQLGDDYHAQYQSHPEEQVEEDDGPPPPPRPYRANTTNLATDHLPAPPGRRDGADGRGPPPLPPPSYQTATATATAAGSKPGPPSLPPRLPPRTNSASSGGSSASGLVNAGAVSRLGAAGISVPGLGIGRSSPSPSPANASSPGTPPPPPRPGAAPALSHLNDLTNRFSKLHSSSSSSLPAPAPSAAAPAAAPAPAEGTTWAQKQAALKTASAFHKDPSSVSFADAKAAAGTANNFRQRHGEQVAAGMQKAHGLDQKYGLSGKVAGYAGGQNGQEQNQNQNQGFSVPSPSALGLAGKKKPPPPPPPKKRAFGGIAPPPGPPPASADEDTPPPIPMSTRPQF